MKDFKKIGMQKLGISELIGNNQKITTEEITGTPLTISDFEKILNKETGEIWFICTFKEFSGYYYNCGKSLTDWLVEIQEDDKQDFINANISFYLEVIKLKNKQNFTRLTFC